MPINEREGVVRREPRTAAERAKLAAECRAALKLSIPTLLDGMDNAVGRAYAAWPDRLYLVGKDGRIAYKGRPGPGGFGPRELEQALDSLAKPSAVPHSTSTSP